MSADGGNTLVLDKPVHDKLTLMPALLPMTLAEFFHTNRVREPIKRTVIVSPNTMKQVLSAARR